SSYQPINAEHDSPYRRKRNDAKCKNCTAYFERVKRGKRHWRFCETRQKNGVTAAKEQASGNEAQSHRPVFDPQPIGHAHEKTQRKRKTQLGYKRKNRPQHQLAMVYAISKRISQTLSHKSDYRRRQNNQFRREKSGTYLSDGHVLSHHHR